MYVQYGCGLTAPTQWKNFDVSPTLRIQKLPIIGKFLKSQLNAEFPSNVIYGNIIEGLPIEDNSCDGIYCSHVLEHLSLDDFKLTLQNTYRVLKDGGIFRCVVPDIEFLARQYIKNLEAGDAEASVKFIEDSMLGIKRRPRSMKDFVVSFFGNSHHLWMWDKQSLAKELEKVGFKNVREASFNDSEDSMFNFVEEEERFQNAVALQCQK